MLNKYSRILTQNIGNGASQAMLYALNMKKKDLSKAQVGIGAVWYESNPCNAKLNKLSQLVSESLNGSEFHPFKFNSVGVSDGITMGTEGMRYSLPSRDLIANNFETIVNAHYYDGLVCIPGCDKNLPGVLMAMCRLNRPSYIIYGGSMPPNKVDGEERDIVTAFEKYGSYIKGDITKDDYECIVQNCCNKIGGSCSGLYTANTMASLFEVMGLTVPNSSSYPANSFEKYKECISSKNIIKSCFELDLTPKRILTKTSFINAIKMLYCTGGSTNAIIHLLAIANELDIKLDINEFNEYAHIPVLLNMKPHGTNMMYHLHKEGGMSIFIQYLIGKGILDGNQLTITGKTLEENVINYNKVNNNIKSYEELEEKINNQTVITPVEKPFKKNNHIKLLTGNIAKNGCITKIYNDSNLFMGKAIVFENEEDMIKALDNNEITREHIVIIRGQGETMGCPEMLRPTSALVGYFGDSAPPLMTDGRFSGGSKGILVAHLDDMYKKESNVGLIMNDDIITIDTKLNKISLDISEDELRRRQNFKIYIVRPKFKNGYLNTFSKYVGSIRKGFVIE